MRIGRHFFPPVVVAFAFMFSALGYLVVELESTQQEIQSTQIEGFKTRVITVEQRCELTKLNLEEARHNNSPFVVRLEHSLHGCKASLAAVKHLAEHR